MNKAVMLVVLLAAGMSLVILPVDSSAASGSHPGAVGSGDGVTVTYDGTPGAERFLFEFDVSPSSMDTAIFLVQDDRYEEVHVPLQKRFLLNLLLDGKYTIQPFDYGDLTIMMSNVSGTIDIYMTLQESYTVSYASGLSDTFIPFQSILDGQSVSVSDCPVKEHDGKFFKGWQYGSAIYLPGETVRPSSDMTLSAVWEQSDQPSDGDWNPTLIAFAALSILAVIIVAVVFLLRRRVA